MKKKLGILLHWENFSEYYCQELAKAVSNVYDSFITYDASHDFSNCDVALEFFPKGHFKSNKRNALRLFWEPHEYGELDPPIYLNAACCLRTFKELLREEEARNYPKNTFYVPMGINTKHFFPQPFPNKEKLQIGWAGAATNLRKQFLELKKCIESIEGVEFIPNVMSYVSGKAVGPIEKTNQMGEYYKTIDVYTCSSLVEGFCLPLLEASACGRPIITFDVGITSELKEQGAGVIIVEDFEEMKKEIIKLRDNRYLLPELGKKSSKAVVDNWSWEVVGHLWMDLFKKAEENAKRK